jgi:hypothetical protein
MDLAGTGSESAYWMHLAQYMARLDSRLRIYGLAKRLSDSQGGAPKFESIGFLALQAICSPRCIEMTGFALGSRSTGLRL